MAGFCRFCAEQLSLLDWTECIKVSQQYLDMFESLTDYIDKDDKILPKTACGACFDAFKVTKAFYNKIKQSQFILRELYKQEELHLKANEKEGHSDMILRESNVDKSSEQQETLPSAVSNSSAHTLDANLITDNAVIIYKEQCITNCFVLLDKIKLSPKELSDSSMSNEREDWIKEEPDESMLKHNVSSNNNNYTNEGHQVSEDDVIETLVVKIESDCDTETSSFELVEDDDNYMDKPDKSLLESDIQSGDNIDRKVDNNSSTKFQAIMREVDSNVSIRTSDDSWTDYKCVCSHCETVFENMTKLRTHSKEAHKICYGFKCLDCGKQYVFNSFLEHVRQHREVLRQFCPFCNQRFEDGNNLNKHVATHLNAQQTVCDFCGEIFMNRSQLVQHMSKYQSPYHVDKEHTIKVNQGSFNQDKTVKPHICHICGISFWYRSWLSKHMNTHFRTSSNPRNVVNFISDHCGRYFKNKYLLEQHILTKHSPWSNKYLFDICGMTEVICDYCGTKFGYKHDLYKHIIIKHKQKSNYTCNVCSKSFATAPGLKKHMACHTVNRKKEFACNTCSKSFYDLNNLRKHMTTHGTKRQGCNVCSKVFHYPFELRKHMKCHDVNRKREFTCNICNKSYYRLYHLKKHMNSHDVDRKRGFTCSVCSKSFYEFHHFKKHRKTHDVNRKRMFLCKTCGNTYRGEKFSIQHAQETKHTLEEIQPFICDICDNSYFLRSSLIRHISVHSAKKT